MSTMINVKKKVTSNLPLKPIKLEGAGYKFGGFVPADLINVELRDVTYERGEFEGTTAKTLVLEFNNHKLSSNDVERVMTHSEKPIGTKVFVGENREDRKQEDIDKNINDMWGRIKHILDGLKLSDTGRDIENISQADIDKYFNIKSNGTPNEIVASYNAFFEYIVKFINGKANQKCMYHIGDKEYYPCFLKLLPNYDKDPKRNRKWHNIPTFVGSGFFEAMRFDAKGVPLLPLTLEFKPSESLELNAGIGVQIKDSAAPGADVNEDDVISQLGV